jgi:hypothetical protein
MFLAESLLCGVCLGVLFQFLQPIANSYRYSLQTNSYVVLYLLSVNFENKELLNKL